MFRNITLPDSTVPSLSLIIIAIWRHFHISRDVHVLAIVTTRTYDGSRVDTRSPSSCTVIVGKFKLARRAICLAGNSWDHQYKGYCSVVLACVIGPFNRHLTSYSEICVKCFISLSCRIIACVYSPALILAGDEF